MAPEPLANMLNKSNRRKTTNETKNPSEEKINLNKTRLAIALCLQYPSIAAELRGWEWLEKSEIPGKDILFTLLQKCQENPKINTANLLEIWRTHANFKALNQLANWTFAVTAQGIKAELESLLTRLEAEEKDNEIDQMLKTAKTKELSMEQKELLNKLLKERQTI